MLLRGEIIYRSFDGGTDYTLNDQTSINSGFEIAPYYYIRVNSNEGFYGTDVETESYPIPHANWERSGDTFRRGKGFALAGYIEGRNLNVMTDAAEYLMATFWDTRNRKLIWKWKTTGDDVYMTVRIVNDITIVENYESFSPRWAWSVGLRADDPRIRKLSDNTLWYGWQA